MAIPLPGQQVRGSRRGAPVMALLDLLGRSWALGVLWTLAEQGGCGFAELQRRCESISPGVLSTRLKDLTEAGLVNNDAGDYVLTGRGEELVVLIKPLGQWARGWAKDLTGTRHPDKPGRGKGANTRA